MNKSVVKRKIVLLLLSGVALGLTSSPTRQLRIYRELSKEWKKINREQLKREARNLYRSKNASISHNEDGSLALVLTDKGKVKALTYRFQELRLKKRMWTGEWTMVVFDIPEDRRKARDSLRWKLKELGFHEFQKSVFLFPYACKDEIDFIVEFYGVQKYVRYGILRSIDYDANLRKKFRLQ